MFWKRRTPPSFPSSWSAIVEGTVDAWVRVDDDERTRWGRLVAGFVPSVRWEGAGGFEVEEHHRVVIAAQACLPVLAHDLTPYRRIGSVVVYPSPMVRRGRRGLGGGMESIAPLPIHGETRPGGPVVIAWSAALGGARHPQRGRDVVIHEFAHQLDFDSGALDGMPRILGGRNVERAWQDTIEAVYARLISEGDGVLGTYAATNHGELFAVATERFFGRPHALVAEHPDLFELLLGFYRQDPRRRFEP